MGELIQFPKTKVEKRKVRNEPSSSYIMYNNTYGVYTSNGYKVYTLGEKTHTEEDFIRAVKEAAKIGNKQLEDMVKQDEE